MGATALALLDADEAEKRFRRDLYDRLGVRREGWFPGGLTAHFQEGRLVGWNWHLAQDGDAPATGTVKLAGEVQVGSARGVAEAAPGFAPVEGSTLGEEFAIGEAIGGFITGDKVEMLYAGTQCFFR